MEIPDFSQFIDTEVVYSVSYWLLTAFALIGLMIGFKVADSWGNGGIPFISQIAILICIPVISYFIVMYNQRR